MQPRFVAGEINPDVLINTPAPHFGTEKKKKMSVCIFLFCHSYTRVYRVLIHTQEGRIKKMC